MRAGLAKERVGSVPVIHRVLQRQRRSGSGGVFTPACFYRFGSYGADRCYLVLRRTLLASGTLLSGFLEYGCGLRWKLTLNN